MTLAPRQMSRTEPRASSIADVAYMRRAIALAWEAAGHAAPNPMVGAVVVRDGGVISEGYHTRCGSPHAEVEALRGIDARGATLFVTLEPCSHHGRTPPCSDAVIASGVRRVLVSTLDPDERVWGRGVAQMRAAGIDVEVGCLADAAIALNLGYFKRQLGMRGAVTLKMAHTLDGKIASAPGRRDDITGDDAREMVHRLRAVHDAVAVGSNTLLVDRPRLDCRYLDGVASPLPVALDGRGRFPQVNAWSEARRQFAVVTRKEHAHRLNELLSPIGGKVVSPNGDGRLNPRAIVSALENIGRRDLMIEGGASVFTSFTNSQVWDAIYLFDAMKVFNEEGVPLASGPLDTSEWVGVDVREFGDDRMRVFLRRETIEEIRRRVL